MKLYYSKGACSLAPRILINELNISCDYESVNLATKKTGSGEDFLNINSKGAVPTLVLDTGEVLTENVVIHQYLAHHANASRLLPSENDFYRYRVLEWLNFITTELHKGFGVFFTPSIPKDIVETVFKPLLIKKFTYVDSCLENKKYLMGEEFGLPDSYLFVMLRYFYHFELDAAAPLKNLARYFDTMKERASIKKSLQEEGL